MPKQKIKIETNSNIELPTDSHSVPITLTLPFADFAIIESIRKKSSHFKIQETIRQLLNAQLIAKGYK